MTSVSISMLFRTCRNLILGTAVALAAPCCASAAITPILSPAGFSPPTITDDFDYGVLEAAPLNTAQFTYESTAVLASAAGYANGVTPSGAQGLADIIENDPMRIVFTTPVHEVGLFFGNDDFGYVFNANLELFDAANVSLGVVRVLCNKNDSADQFIGISSTIPAKSAAIYYDRPAAGQLAIYIDNLTVGGLVPEPCLVALLAPGLVWLTSQRRSRCN